MTWLIQVLGAWLGARGFVLGSEIKLVTGESSGRKPGCPGLSLDVDALWATLARLASE